MRHGDASIHRLVDLCRLFLRPPSGITGGPDDAVGFEFIPPLSTAEQAIFADLQTMARFGVTLTLAEWQAIKEDAAGLKQYLGVTSPTAAQTTLATKAIIRVLATIIRD